ncbi:MAG: hypothetical protein K2W95_07155 [Candidatus Obscuribacterales bacterium]|nr:hypothetical protein [Candidatus Obscuribacterales bacterium]
MSKNAYINEQAALEIMRTAFGAPQRKVISGDLTDLHLQRNGIDLARLSSYPEPLRSCPRVVCWTPQRGKFYAPAMLAVIRDNDGNLVQVHRTFLALDGSGLAKIPDPKRLMPSPCPGVTKGAVIRLFAARETLGIAGSIEEALRQHLKTGLPIWVAITARSVETLVLPPIVNRVLVFADDEMTYDVERAANALAERL